MWLVYEYSRRTLADRLFALSEIKYQRKEKA